jgi:hypothetical protein
MKKIDTPPNFFIELKKLLEIGYTKAEACEKLGYGRHMMTRLTKEELRIVNEAKVSMRSVTLWDGKNICNGIEILNDNYL